MSLLTLQLLLLYFLELSSKNGEAVSTSAFCALRFVGPTCITLGKGEISVTGTLHDSSFSTDDVLVRAEDGSIGGNDGSADAEDVSFRKRRCLRSLLK